MALTKGKIAKYMLLPGLLPRMGTLFGTGFYHVAFLIAIIFQTVRLIPRDHPYLDQRNLGRFGVRHVVAEAASNLKFNWRNADQVFVFFMVLTGMMLLIVQIVLIGMALMFDSVVYAGSNDFRDWFTIPSPTYAYDETNDIALMLLDRIFGVRDIFNSCISVAGATCTDHNGVDITPSFTYPAPLHLALHSLFRMYSIGIGLMALMVIIYLTMTVIGEMAVTGTAFGQRFNRAWTPVRLVVFFALLAPLNIGEQNAGLNGGQIVTLWVSKFGSNFATNAWGLFNEETSRVFYEPEQLIAIPGTPDFSNMAQFWTIALSCMHAQKVVNNKDIWVYRIVEGSGSPPTIDVFQMVTGVNMMPPGNTIGHSTLYFVVGERDEDAYANYRGSVKPICGEVVVPYRVSSWLSGDAETYEAGAERIFSSYYRMVQSYFAPDPNDIDIVGGPALPHLYPDIITLARCTMDRTLQRRNDPCQPADPFTSYQELVSEHLGNLGDAMQDIKEVAVGVQISPVDLSLLPGGDTFDPFELSDELIGRGWAGAAIWYNRIAQMNSSLASAMHALPYVKAWPLVMEEVKKQQMENNENVTVNDLFNPSMPNGEIARLSGPQDDEMARAYYGLYKFWNDNAVTIDPSDDVVGNPVLDAINAVFGTQGLFDMREQSTGGGAHEGNADLANPYRMTVHPLALLSSFGSALVQSSIQNLATAAGASLGSGLLGILTSNGNNAASVLMSTVSSFLTTVASFTIIIGFMLAYVVPMMPFVYFLFALGGWVKSIFEAMVAIPIWALGHLRIDGEGLPGRGASNGYYLLLEIFIRPVLILIGLIASIVIFSAMVQILNSIFNLMIVNMGGSNTVDPVTPADIEFFRGPIDELFYSIMYAVIVYMMGVSCFKMIDQVPNNVLRWMGVSVQTFREAQGDPAGRMAQSIYQKSQMGVGQLTGAFRNDPGKFAALASS